MGASSYQSQSKNTNRKEGSATGKEDEGCLLEMRGSIAGILQTLPSRKGLVVSGLGNHRSLAMWARIDRHVGGCGLGQQYQAGQVDSETADCGHSVGRLATVRSGALAFVDEKGLRPCSGGHHFHLR